MRMKWSSEENLNQVMVALSLVFRFSHFARPAIKNCAMEKRSNSRAGTRTVRTIVRLSLVSEGQQFAHTKRALYETGKANVSVGRLCVATV